MINSYYTEQLSINDLADKLYISRRHLDRIITAKYGKTLRELVTSSRINLAKKLLEGGEMSIDAIASHVGFSSTPAFRRSFSQACGMTPNEYRKNSSKGS